LFKALFEIISFCDFPFKLSIIPDFAAYNGYKVCVVWRSVHLEVVNPSGRQPDFSFWRVPLFTGWSARQASLNLSDLKMAN
jgi:hypothetical protein